MRGKKQAGSRHTHSHIRTHRTWQNQIESNAFDYLLPTEVVAADEYFTCWLYLITGSGLFNIVYKPSIFMSYNILRVWAIACVSAACFFFVPIHSRCFFCTSLTASFTFLDFLFAVYLNWKQYYISCVYIDKSSNSFEWIKSPDFIYRMKYFRMSDDTRPKTD